MSIEQEADELAKKFANELCEQVVLQCNDISAGKLPRMDEAAIFQEIMRGISMVVISDRKLQKHIDAVALLIHAAAQLCMICADRHAEPPTKPSTIH